MRGRRFLAVRYEGSTSNRRDAVSDFAKELADRRARLIEHDEHAALHTEFAGATDLNSGWAKSFEDQRADLETIRERVLNLVDALILALPERRSDTGHARVRWCPHPAPTKGALPLQECILLGRDGALLTGIELKYVGRSATIPLEFRRGNDGLRMTLGGVPIPRKGLGSDIDAVLGILTHEAKVAYNLLSAGVDTRIHFEGLRLPVLPDKGKP